MEVLQTQLGVGLTFTTDMFTYQIATEDGFTFSSEIGISETPFQFIQRVEEAYTEYLNDGWRALQEAYK